MTRLYLRNGAVREGPLAVDEVRERVATGRMPQGALVSPDGRDGWVPFEQHPALATAVAERRRAAAPTLVGVQAPGRVAAPDPVEGGVELSLSGAGPPEVVAVPRAGERARWVPSRGLLIAGALLALLGLAGLGGAWLVLTKEPEPLPLEIVSTRVDEVDRAALEELVEEEVIVELRTEPGARVRVSGGPEAVADSSGLATARYPFGRTREPSVEVRVVATLGEERVARASATVERPHRLRVRGAVAECSTRACALGVEADGALTVSGVGPDDEVTLGGVTARGAVPDASEPILAALSPDALFVSSRGPSLPLRIALADGAVFEGDYPISEWTARLALYDRFVTAEDGAVSVPGDGTGSATLWIGGVGEGRSASGMQLVGEAESVSDIGRVALVETRVQRRRCGAYGSGSAARTVYVEQHHAVVSIYDRRRGRRIRTRTVSAPRPACPSQVTLEPGGEGDVVADTSAPELSAVEAVL